MIAPLEMRVPPIGYGGTELVVSLLTEELVKSGHDVTLFASGDSVTSAKLVSVCPEFLRGKQREKSIYNLRNVVACLERATGFDIIHNHTLLEGLSLAGLTRTPMLTTLHGDLKNDWRQLFLDYKGWYNTISNSAKRLLPEKDQFAGVVYNAIDVKSYPFNDSPGEYMLFLARMSREKGPHLAIEVSRRLNRKLILAGNIDTVDEQYFREEVLPRVDNDLIKFVGEADNKMKRDLMSGAICLLAPITWDEPFGLFLVEAMACGTPVIIFNRGSAPEVVKNGETGYVVDTIEEMVRVVNKVSTINRRRCREHVELNFDVPKLGKNYLQAYSMVLQQTIPDNSNKLEAVA
jgi:glycosyltransferase involved in cell wall biosynthesis